MRRRFLLAVPVLLLLGAALWVFTAGSAGVSRAKFDRITDGMSREEVDALFGGQSIVVIGGYGTDFYYSDPTGFLPVNTVHVGFVDGKVENKTFYPWTVADWVGQVRDRLGI
jgi:hypothetical protein